MNSTAQVSSEDPERRRGQVRSFEVRGRRGKTERRGKEEGDGSDMQHGRLYSACPPARARMGSFLAVSEECREV
jgi:hypothetical protein